MLTYPYALELAETWVRLMTNDSAVVTKEKTLKRPYGWVFFYQGRAYLASGDRREMLLGTAPIIIDRVSGNIQVTGTGEAIETYLSRYEMTIPKARLRLDSPKEP